MMLRVRVEAISSNSAVMSALRAESIISGRRARATVRAIGSGAISSSSLPSVAPTSFPAAAQSNRIASGPGNDDAAVWMTNHLGPFLFTECLTPALTAAAALSML